MADTPEIEVEVKQYLVRKKNGELLPAIVQPRAARAASTARSGQLGWSAALRFLGGIDRTVPAGLIERWGAP